MTFQQHVITDAELHHAHTILKRYPNGLSRPDLKRFFQSDRKGRDLMAALAEIRRDREEHEQTRVPSECVPEEAMRRLYLDWVARKPCVRCGAHGVEIAHVRAFRSPKTDDLLPRRAGIAQVAVLPLCPACHRTARDSIHNVGESAFERDMGRGDGYLAQKAGSLIAEYMLQ